MLSDGTTTYQYDAYGNLEYEKQGAETERQYYWDGENHLLKVDLYASGSVVRTVAMSYDDQGGRVGRKQTAGATVEADNRYLTDYGNPTGYSQVLEQLDSSATSAEKDFIYGADLLAQVDSGGAAFLLSDCVRSAQLFTNANGLPIDGTNFDYAPFGEIIDNSQSDQLVDAFTGEILDSALGLQYHRARWYYTRLGRWASADSVFDFGFNFGGLYTFAGCDPINATDPSGRYSLLELEICLAISSILNDINFSTSSDALDQAAGIFALYGNTGTAYDAAELIRWAQMINYAIGSVSIAALFAHGIKEGFVAAKGLLTSSEGRVAVGSMARDFQAAERANMTSGLHMDAYADDAVEGVGKVIDDAMDARVSGLNYLDRNDLPWTHFSKDRYGRNVPLYGTPQGADIANPLAPSVTVLGTKGHAEAAWEQAQRLAESGDYEYIVFNRSWRTATSREAASTLRPDIIAVRRDGRIDAWEVKSMTDDPKSLKARLDSGMQSVPASRRGRVDVIDPKP